MPAPLLQLLPWLVAGILAADAFPLRAPWWTLAVALLAAVAARRRPLLQSLLLGLCLMVAGMVLTARQQRHLGSFTDQGRQTVRAVVVSEATPKAHSVAVDLFAVENGQRVKGYLRTDGRSLALQPGDGLLLTTHIEPTAHLRLGTFDYGRYLQVHGFTGRCFADSTAWQADPGAWHSLPRTERLKARALRWRHGQLLRLHEATQGDSTVYGVLAAMTLGEKSALSAGQRAVYAETGASHVLALSGLHLGILFCLFSMMLRPGRRSVVAVLLAVLPVWAFALLTGLGPSVVRSALMLSLSAIFSLRHGGKLSLNVVALAAIIMLLANPYTLFDVGFQLSFMSVFAILLLTPLLDSLWPRDFLWRHGLVRRLWALVAVSIAAQAGTAPLVAFYFGSLSVVFIVTNLVAIPCAYAILWLALAYLLWPLAATGRALVGVVSLLNDSLTALASWPFACVADLHPSPVQVVLAYAAIVSLALMVSILGKYPRLP